MEPEKKKTIEEIKREIAELKIQLKKKKSNGTVKYIITFGGIGIVLLVIILHHVIALQKTVYALQNSTEKSVAKINTSVDTIVEWESEYDIKFNIGK